MHVKRQFGSWKSVQTFGKMKVHLLTCIIGIVLTATGVCSMDPSMSDTPFLSHLKRSTNSRRETKKMCYANVGLYPLKWAGIKQMRHNTSEAARSHYDKFDLKVSMHTEYEHSQFQVSIEYGSPEIVQIGGKKVTINWYNLLFTSTLLVHKSPRCQSYKTSYVGFVELIETDTAWYKYKNTGKEQAEWSLANHPDLQYVMTKASQHSIFADDNSVPLHPIINCNRVVPLKYESIENITIDFSQYPETLEYERLIKKKIFLVQASRSGQVLKVIAGIDVMMYLNYVTDNVTDVVHLTLNKNHSLIQWVVNAERYASVLADKTNHISRDRELTYKSTFNNPNVATLNPLLSGQKILYTGE